MPGLLSRLGRAFAPVPLGENRDMNWFATDPDVTGHRVVTVEKSTYLGPVFAALRHIVDFVSTLPVDGYRSNPDGSRSPAPLMPLLRGQNELGRPGLKQWLGQAAYGLAAHGNAVGWVVETDGYGYPSVVSWLRRESWQFNEMDMQWYIGGTPVPPSKVFHIPWIVPIGCTLGMSPIEHHAAIVRAGLSAQEYADIRRGGGLPPAHLKNNRITIDPDQSARVRERAVAAFSTGKPFVTGVDWDLSLTTIPPNHAQFIETLRLSAKQIAAIYGIDEREIGGEPNEPLKYSTDESRALNRANNMRPYLERLEDAFNRAAPERQFVKFNVDATIRTDIKTRIEIEDIQIKNRTLSRNEARALEDRTPIPGGDSFDPPTPPTPAAPPSMTNGATP